MTSVLIKSIMRNGMVYLFVSALVVRLIYITFLYSNDFHNNLSDDIAYMNLADQMIKQGIFVTDLENLGLYSSVVGPGIGWLLIPVILLFGTNWLPVFITTAIISSIIPALIYRLSKLLVSQNAAFLAGTWSVFYMPFVKYTLSAGKDIWMTLLLILLILSLFRLKKNPRTVLLIAISIIYTFLFHLDERFLLISPLIIIYFLFFTGLGKSTRFKQTALFIAFVLLLSIPWTIRNHIVYDKIILISVRTAPYTDKIFGYTPIEYFPSHEGRWYLSPKQLDSIQNDEIVSEIEKTLEPQHIDAIKNGNLPHKFTSWETMKATFVNFWQPIDLQPSYYQSGFRFDPMWSLKHNLSIGLTYGVILLFSLYGIYMFFKNYHPDFFFIILLILLYSAIHVFLIPFTHYRYRIPIDPYIIILGCYGIQSLYTKWLRRNEESS